MNTIPKELIHHGKHQDYLLMPDNQQIWIFETGKLIGKADFPRTNPKFFYSTKQRFLNFLEDIEDEIQLKKAEKQQILTQYQKHQADQFFNSSFYQSMKNVDVPIPNSLKKTHDRGKENWIQKMTENMTKIETF